MRILRGKGEISEALATARAGRARIGLVPTMGSLHDGHLSLIRTARSECPVVVVSLFVNPTQFGDSKDLASYPRDETSDARFAGAAGADFLFAPSADEVYARGSSTTVRVAGLTDVLCGAPEHRGAEHFLGVTTVVAKLLNIVGPDVAYFGQKDAQQVAVVKRMVTDLDFPVRIATVPTVREPDGLALSSRNARLSAGDRDRATSLYRALQAVERAAKSGASVEAALDAGSTVLEGAGIAPEYFEARDAATLAPVEDFNGRAVLVAIAVLFESVRLIDNVVIESKLADT